MDRHIFPKAPASLPVPTGMGTGRRAFTLIELLVVIGVLATLMAILLPSLAMVREQSRRASTQSTLGQVKAALEQYRSMRGAYPAADGWEGAVLGVASGDFPKGLIDAWEGQIQYLDARHYPRSFDDKPVPRPDSYWLWSNGPNQVPDPYTWEDPATKVSVDMPHGGDDDLADWR